MEPMLMTTTKNLSGAVAYDRLFQDLGYDAMLIFSQAQTGLSDSILYWNIMAGITPTIKEYYYGFCIPGALVRFSPLLSASAPFALPEKYQRIYISAVPLLLQSGYDRTSIPYCGK